MSLEEAEGDRLSNLHDCLLTQILSSLPTKESVRTSTLSKRWRHVWFSVPNLEISVSHGDHADVEPLLRRLRHREVGGGLDIRKFVFKSNSLCSHNGWCDDCTSRARAAVLHAAAHRLRHLKVQMGSGASNLGLDSDATQSIFRCQSLESLSLFAVRLSDCKQQMLPNLRVLDISLEGDWAGKLISHCPFLKRLKVSGDYSNRPASSTTAYNIFSCRSLEFLDLNHLRLEATDLPNPICLVKLRVLGLRYISVDGDPTCTEIVMDCPALEDLSSFVPGYLELLTISAPNLRRLEIPGKYGSSLRGFPKLNYAAINNFRGCQSLESLLVRNVAILELPNSICLNMLRVLHMVNVSPVHGDLGEIISSCWVLEELWLLDVKKLNVLNISAHKLKEFRLNSRTLDELRIFCKRLELFEFTRPGPFEFTPPGLLKNFEVDMPTLVYATISLNKVYCQDHWNVDQIIAKCPVLEDLRLCAGQISVVKFSAPCLKNLKLSSLNATDIWISCPRLENFDFQCSKKLKYFEGDMPSLIEASISLEDHKCLYNFSVHHIIRSLKNATIIHLRPSAIKLCPHHLLEGPECLPPFPNLKTLALHACLDNDNIEALIYWLEHSPNLHVLRIKHKSNCLCLGEEASWTSRKSSSEILEHLKKVIIPKKIFNKDEFVKFLSMNVVAWDRVTKIMYTSSHSVGGKNLGSK